MGLGLDERRLCRRRNASWLCALAGLSAATSRAGATEPIDVVVEAPPSTVPSKDSGTAGSVVRRDRLQAPGLEGADVLRSQPGVTVFDTGGHGAPSTAVIRGATSAQTPVYLAGVRLNDDVGGAADLSLVPLWFVDRVEVYRSNAPLEADALGIGGAIFFEPRLPTATEAGAGTMAGSYGARALWGYAGVGDSNSGALFGVRADGAKNDYPFVDDRGTRFDPTDDRVRTRTNADTRTLDGWAVGRVRLRDGDRLQMLANDTEREQGLPGLTLFPSRRARARTARRLASVSSRLACAASERCVLNLSTAVLSASTEYRDPLREIALGTTRLDVDASRVEQGVNVRYRPVEWVTLTPGVRVAAERSRFEAAGVPELVARRAFGRAALGAEASVAEALTLRAVGSVECHRTTASGKTPWSFPSDFQATRDGNACNDLEASARLGAELAHDGWAVLANAGRYARVPTLSELYGISGAVRGNGDLEPEKGLSFDAGVRLGHERAHLDLFGFVRFAERLIAYQRSGLGYVRPYNVGRARVSGSELLAGYRPVKVVLLELSATLIDARNTSPRRPVNDVLPYQPRLTLAPRVEIGSRVNWASIDSAKLSLSYFHQASRYADAAGLVVIPAQGSLDLEAEIGLLRELVSLRGRVANLLDQSRTDLIGYPLPGRTEYIALEAKW